MTFPSADEDVPSVRGEVHVVRPEGRSDRSNAFRAALISTAFMMASCLNLQVRSSPSASMAPGVDGRSHFS